MRAFGFAAWGAESLWFSGAPYYLKRLRLRREALASRYLKGRLTGKAKPYRTSGGRAAGGENERREANASVLFAPFCIFQRRSSSDRS